MYFLPTYFLEKIVLLEYFCWVFVEVYEFFITELSELFV